MNHRRTGAAVFLLAATIVAVLGCGGSRRSPAADAATHQDPLKAYRAAFKTWTREARIYDGFELKLIANATFRSQAFRRAYSRAYARTYRLPPAESEKLVTDQLKAAETYHDMMLAVFVPQKQWDDFAEIDSMWKIVLETKTGRQIKPLEIRKRDKRDAVIRHFYPFTSPWKSVYQLRFPVRFEQDAEPILPDPAADFRLMIISIHGAAKMRW